MRGPDSSEGSRSDAGLLVDNLGIDLLTSPFSDLYYSYRLALSQAFGDRPENVAEENLQARIRGNFLMALSNKFGSMVLSTGNKSEMAVRECTLLRDHDRGPPLPSGLSQTNGSS